MRKKIFLKKSVLSFLLSMILFFNYSSMLTLAEGEEEESGNGDIVVEEDEIVEANVKSSDIVNYACQFEGYPYVFGTAGPNTFDCSGLVKYVFAHFGINLPHGTVYFAGNGYQPYGSKISDTGDLKAGDLVFFGESATSLGHVGICIGNGIMINAMNPNKGVVKCYINKTEWERYGSTGTFFTGNFQFGVRVYGVDGHSGADVCTISDTGVTNVSRDSARINATISPMAYVSELGFYLGTTADNMEKHVESFSGKVINIWYDLGTGKWTGALSERTKYYYKIYAVIDGKVLSTDVGTFVTGGPGKVLVDKGVSNLTRTSATITAELPEMKYCTEDGFLLGTSPDNMKKTSEAGGGNTLKVWFDLGTGKWTSALEKGTTYYYQLYVITGGVTYYTDINSFTTLGDNKAPNIVQAYITDLSPDGYTVICEALDDVGIERVICPTWTDYNGQDDLKGDYYNDTKAALTGNNTYSYKVSISDHNNERGKYITDVYAYDAEGNFTRVQLSVVVPTYISSLTLSETALTIKEGDSATLTATITPSDATIKDLTWASEDERVVTVDNGKLTAIAPGKALIYAFAQDPSGKSATCEVTVIKASDPEPVGKTTVIVADVKAAVGSKVEVPVSISNNQGIAGAAFTVKYDKSVFTLDELKAGTVFSSGTFTTKTDSDLVQWYYAGEGSIKTNGVMFTAVFTVNSSAANGDYAVTVGLLNDDNANLTDHNGAEVPVAFNAGKVTVSDKVKGDLTGDGCVAMGDVVKVARAVAGYITLTEEETALADVTGDGSVAMGDVVMIARYVAGYIDSL